MPFIYRSALLPIAAAMTLQAAAFAPTPRHLATVTPTLADAVAVAQVRIVRLSQVNGRVLLDRGTEHGFETAFANLPVAQGARLQTAQGLAEVEFEDNSSLRIAPDSQVDFRQLGREATGATTNKMMLVKGTLYLSLTKAKGNDFEVSVQGKDISLPPASHIRIDVYPDGSELAVFHGKVLVTDSLSHATWTVGTDKAFKFTSAPGAQPVLVADGRPGLYDQWDKTQATYHNNRVGSAFAGTPYQYGLNDLSFYGGFNNVVGCGQVWQPYFTSASWDPFGTGVWAWYPGTGYSWVSPYPWGWTPFHSGSWVSCSNGAGWGWRPGRNWTALNNGHVLSPIRRPLPLPPPRPLPGRSGLVVVGATLARVSHVMGGQRFEFTKDSAGLGVPRDLPVKLQKMSVEVSMRGTIQAPVRGIESPNVSPPALRTAGASSLGPPKGATSQRSETMSIMSQHETSRPLAPIGTGPATTGSGSYSSYGSNPSSGSTVSPSSIPINQAPAITSSGAVQGGGKTH